MQKERLVQIFFDGVMCFVDLENNEIYSAKLKKMKGQTQKGHNDLYYMIKYNGKRKYMTLNRLINLAQVKKGIPNAMTFGIKIKL